MEVPAGDPIGVLGLAKVCKFQHNRFVSNLLLNSTDFTRFERTSKLNFSLFIWHLRDVHLEEFMGTYLNPGNKGFQEILQAEYVDKTGLTHCLRT